MLLNPLPTTVPRHFISHFFARPSQIGGRQFHALSWVLENASPVLAGLLSNVKDISEHVILPNLGDLNDLSMYATFQTMTSWAHTGELAPPKFTPMEALDLWVLAIELEIPKLAAVA